MDARTGSLLRSAAAELRLKVGTGRGLAVAISLLAVGQGAAMAQSTVGAQSDWNGNYGFSSTADRNLRLLQADLIRKSESGYYESMGQQTFNVNNTTHATTHNSSITEVGQQTTTIGAVNNATNTIDIRDSTRIDLSLENASSSIGCQNGAISIDSRPSAEGTATCN